MPDRNRAPPERTARSIAARAGLLLSAFAVFTCGWLAMQTSDWRRIVLFSALALAAGALASVFARSGR